MAAQNAVNGAAGIDDPTLRWFAPRRSTAVALLLACLALLPFGALYNVPLLVLCGLGVLCLATRPRKVLGDDGFRLLLTLFLCIWLPMTISAVDAVNPAQSWRKVASFPVFFLAGAYVVVSLRRIVDARLLLTGMLAVCVLWSIDACWQLMHGVNLFGFSYQGGRVPGIFHPDLKLGIVLATLSPLVFEAMRQLARRSVWIVLTSIPFFAAIVLSGSRSSWIVLLVVLGCYGWYLFRWVEEPMVPGRAILRVAAVGVLACGVLACAFPNAASQVRGLLVDRAMPIADLASGDRQTSDVALIARLTAWESAGRIFRAHWFNGVGPRGFRDVHAQYAPAHDPYVQRGQALNHPHMMVLEIAAETGVVGLIGYLLALAVLMHRFLAMGRTQLSSGFPFLLAILVVLFPFATHMAFYAHFMGALVWWTIAVSAAGLGSVSRCTNGNRRPPSTPRRRHVSQPAGPARYRMQR